MSSSYITRTRDGDLIYICPDFGKNFIQTNKSGSPRRTPLFSLSERRVADSSFLELDGALHIACAMRGRFNSCLIYRRLEGAELSKERLVWEGQSIESCALSGSGGDIRVFFETLRQLYSAKLENKAFGEAKPIGLSKRRFVKARLNEGGRGSDVYMEEKNGVLSIPADIYPGFLNIAPPPEPEPTDPPASHPLQATKESPASQPKPQTRLSMSEVYDPFAGLTF